MMKPEDFKLPFKWKERHVLIRDRIWFVPDYYAHYDDFTFPGWEASQLFGNANPVFLEYCSGNGAWIVEKARSDSNCNWVGIEKKFLRVRKIASKAHNIPLHNLLSICGEAYNVTSHYFPSKSVDHVFINFPDPWPKTRHAKHRLIQPRFLTEVWRILKENGTITIVTDDSNYSALTIEEFLEHQGFDSAYPSPYFVKELFGYGTSFFEELWRSKGKEIYYHRFCKKG